MRVHTSPLALGLIAAGQLREDFRRFLGLARELGPDVDIREQPLLVVIERAGEPLCLCRPRATSVLLRLGPGADDEIGCHTYEDFAFALGRLLAKLRAPLPAVDHETG